MTNSVETYKPYKVVNRAGEYVLVNISDLHVPYVSTKALDAVFELEADGIVINGDVLDAGNASKFSHYEVDSLLESYSAVVRLLKEFKDRFKDVFVVAGNHDLRYERMLRRNLVLAELADVFGGLDLLEKACFEAGVNYSRNGFKINDAIFYHPDTYCSTPLATARKALEYMIQFSDDFKLVSIGHTHQLGFGRHLGKLIFESGKMCNITPWERASHSLHTRHTPLGFIVFSFEDCVTRAFTFVEAGE